MTEPSIRDLLQGKFEEKTINVVLEQMESARQRARLTYVRMRKLANDAMVTEKKLETCKKETEVARNVFAAVRKENRNVRTQMLKVSEESEKLVNRVKRWK